MFPPSPKNQDEIFDDVDEKWPLERQEDLLEILDYHQPGKNSRFHRPGLWDAIFDHVNVLHKTLPPVSFHDIEMELERLIERAKEKKNKNESLDDIDLKILKNQVNLKGLTDQQRAEPYATTRARIVEKEIAFYEAINGYHRRRKPANTSAKKSSSPTTKETFTSTNISEGFSSIPTDKKLPNESTENPSSSPGKNIISIEVSAKGVINLSREPTPPPEKSQLSSPLLPDLQIKHSTHPGMPDVGILDLRKIVGPRLKRHHEHDTDSVVKRFRLPDLHEVSDDHPFSPEKHK
ncbi:hypothetical protein BD770DRAFT_428513 [Pilaira anomala]|nr:hypothetical protein BD770DRAFT_428513 [Pilaira anomala]